ncbi:UvrD-helicase domain-containing protein [Natranaerofaba carboxydovora]|uniref:UvrD-helicase domain-containing protein n=1 Tax=Natranaerofaba carboxydovora TaxID=2742683 RepID=UPI001F141565|nr:UvrD-helicase domain-containing protein [Natranaerofaba carboxydovora]
MNKKITPPDQNVRERIEKEVDSNFLVEAGAGSGKTRSLVQRMTSLISSGKYRAGEIAAITFTRKAAAELRERFQNELEKAYTKACNNSKTEDQADSKEKAGSREQFDTEDQTKTELKDHQLYQVEARLKRALEELDEAFIGTIHSFASTLLKERPVETGLDPDFEEIEELEEEALEDEIFEEFLFHVRLNNIELLDSLDRIGINPQKLKDSFKELSSYPDINFYYEELEPPDLNAALEKLNPLIEEAAKNMPEREPSQGYDKLQQAILKTRRYFSYFDMNTGVNIVALLSQFDRVKKNSDVTLNRWQEKEKAKELRDEAIHLRENIIVPVLNKWKEYCHYRIMQFLIPAVKYYSAKREESSYLNFNDLLLRARDMLRDYPEVRRYFQTRYRALLIDEFQDTDPLQSELVFYLTGKETEEKDWQKLTPYPGSLFVVGDPKQSIYRFRRADIDIYNLVKDLLEQKGGEVLELTTNFRSVNSLGSWFDPVFKKLLPPEFNKYQAKHTPLKTVTPDPISDSNTDPEGVDARMTGVRKLEVPAGATNQEKVVEENARQIAMSIRKMLDMCPWGEESYQPADFMIILRYRAMMDKYARALEDEGIPVAMTGGSSMGEVQELHELYKLLALLNEPDNQVYLAAVLRGLFCGIDDNTLYRFKEEGGRLSIFYPGN